MRIDEYEIKFEFKFTDDPAAPARVILDFGKFKIRGFRIQATKFGENKNKYFLSPPSVRGRGGWLKIFWIDDEKLWEKIEWEVLQQFEKEHDVKMLEVTFNE